VDKQYWYDIIYDAAKDRNNRSQQVLMIDTSGRTDALVVPQRANVHQVRDIWKQLLDVTDDVELTVSSGNGVHFHWGLESGGEEVDCTLRAPDFRGNVRIFVGSAHFEAEQISRILRTISPYRPAGRIHGFGSDCGGAKEGSASTFGSRFRRQKWSENQGSVHSLEMLQ
jgi:hypothetical protein